MEKKRRKARESRREWFKSYKIQKRSKQAQNVCSTLGCLKPRGVHSSSQALGHIFKLIKIQFFSPTVDKLDRREI